MMNTQPIFDSGSTLFPRTSPAGEGSREAAGTFGTVLDASLSQDRTATAGHLSDSLPAGIRSAVFGPSNSILGTYPAPPSRKQVATAYAQPAGAGKDPLPVGDPAAGKPVLTQAGKDVPAGSENTRPQANQAPAGSRGADVTPAPPIRSLASASPARGELSAATVQQAGPVQKSAQGSGWQIYKDDQLLRNPGGDHYYLGENRVSEDPHDRESFLARLGKDVSDSFGNVKNFFGNLLMGSKFRYRDENNQIKEATQRGLVGTCVDFFKDLGSALTFGLWHPGEEKGPQGAMERLSYVGSKLKKAFLDDLVEGIPQSVNHMAKNVVLAGLNLVQVLPDATIGNLEGGRKLTTTIFDNGQVMVEYLTDIIPSGDAWFRVHASSLLEGKVPILYNLQMPEYAKGDVRWQYVRNTPFRKTIETVGTLLADIAAIGIAGQTGFSTNQNGDKQRMLKSLIQ
jgi:hypothetical protein